jgi:hypothetical protein
MNGNPKQAHFVVYYDSDAQCWQIDEFETDEHYPERVFVKAAGVSVPNNSELDFLGQITNELENRLGVTLSWIDGRWTNDSAHH